MDLLLYLSKYSNPQKNMIASTLAWLCALHKIDFEVYYEAKRSGEAYGGPPANKEDYFGSTIVGGHHYEDYLMLKNFFDIKYAISNTHSVFTPFLGSNEKIVAKSSNIVEFYSQIFSHFGDKMPNEAVMIETNSVFDLTAYCYPEVFYRKGLGIASVTSKSDLASLKQKGLNRFYFLGTDEKSVELLRSLGIEVVQIEGSQKDATYDSIVRNCANRWLSKAKVLMLADTVLSSYWLPWACRNGALAFPETKLKPNIGPSGGISTIVFGRQNREQDILDLSEQGFCFQIVDPGRPLFSIMEKINFRFGLPQNSFYSYEPSDEQLEEFVKQKKILSSLLFWCPDIRHAEGIYKLLDLVSVLNCKVGVGITAFWYKYAPQIIQLLHTSKDQGGVYPDVEPLIASVGLGVAWERALPYNKIKDCLKIAKETMLQAVSKDFLPQGCFPFLDIALKIRPKVGTDFPFVSPFLRSVDETNTRLINGLKESGFKYLISLANFGKPRVLFSDSDFTVINFTAGKWTGISPYVALNSVDEIRKAERSIEKSRRPGWVLSSIDTPLWLYTKPLWKQACSLRQILEYISHGGESHKIVNVTPHTIARYARILERERLLD